MVINLLLKNEIKVLSRLLGVEFLKIWRIGFNWFLLCDYLLILLIVMYV